MAMPLIEDRALPGLAQAMRIAPMLGNLATAIEARTKGAWSVSGGKFIRFRHRSGARAILHYEIDVTGPHGTRTVPASAWLFAGGKARKHDRHRAQRTADPHVLPSVVIEPVSGALVYLFPADRHTPQLSRFLANHEAFAPGLLRSKPAATPEVMRYRPGLGATFRWAGQDRVAYVKIFAGWQPEQARSRLESLGDLCRDTPVAVPMPLGALDDLGALSLAEAQGVGFADILATGRLPEISRAAGRIAEALAAFHRLAPPGIDRQGPEVLVERARAAARLIGAVSDQLGGKAGEIAVKIASDPKPSRASTAHMDMKIEHLVLDHRKVTLLDIDNVALSDPAYDVALLDAWIAAFAANGRCAADQALAARTSLASEYTRLAPPCWSDRYSWLRACAALQVAKHQVQNPAPGWQRRSRRALDAAFAGVTPCRAMC